jgi:drug/metabolite transporter (DMT)-like permease
LVGLVVWQIISPYYERALVAIYTLWIDGSCAESNAFYKRAYAYGYRSCIITHVVYTIAYYYFGFLGIKRKISWPKSIGLVLGIAGAVVLISSKENNGDASLQGDLLIVLNAISYALYFILVKPLMKIYPPLHVVRWVFTIGFILIIPVGWAQFHAIEWQQMGWTQYIALFAIVCCGTFLAYYFNAFGLQHLGAGITGSYIYTQPLFATLIAVIFLNEQFSFEKLIAGIFIFAGVYLVSRKTPVMVEE